MNEQTLLLSKKHSQLKQAITKMVQTVVGFLDETPDLKTKLSVIETLRTVTEGKIFVEVERARVTKILSDIKKEQGDLQAATDILCELQVETFGSMSRREKTEFILAQVALCIEVGDWTQAGILARKISTKYLSRKPKKTAEQLEKEQKEREKKKARGEEVPEEIPDDTTDLKLQFYEQQIQLAKHDKKYLDVCKHYRQVLDTEAVEEDPAKLHPVRHHLIYQQNLKSKLITYLGTPTHHLLCHPCTPRQRATRPAASHSQRQPEFKDLGGCGATKALYCTRTHAMARGLQGIRTPHLQH